MQAFKKIICLVKGHLPKEEKEIKETKNYSLKELKEMWKLITKGRIRLHTIEREKCERCQKVLQEYEREAILNVCEGWVETLGYVFPPCKFFDENEEKCTLDGAPIYAALTYCDKYSPKPE